jgi:hypothetical protein
LPNGEGIIAATERCRVLLFCYGSLEFAEVMRAVTGRDFAVEPAALDGFARDGLEAFVRRLRVH